MTSTIIYSAVGILLFFFSREIATFMNGVSVRFYEIFPRLKALPRSRFVGTEQNYKTMFYCFRIVGALMALAGIIFLGLILLHQPNYGLRPGAAPFAFKGAGLDSGPTSP